MRTDDRIRAAWHAAFVRGLAGVLLCTGASYGQAPVADVAALDAQAQPNLPTLNWPTGQFVPYALDSGYHRNPARDYPIVFDAVVHVENAAWLRLYFDRVELDAGSLVRITSAYDGEVQELDAAGLAMWHHTSAYFNGDTVYVELVAGPGTRTNRVACSRVAAYVPDFTRGPCAEDDCGICGSDNRTPSDVDWSGRIMPVGCSGSVYNAQSCVVSAGHCAEDGWDNVIQFNVPDSSSNCYPSNPSVANQFPITDHIYSSDGPGDDWAVMTTGSNSLGQTIFERYGVFMPVAAGPASSGDPVDVWGFGVDNGQPTRSQTQQTSGGDIGARYTNRYLYDVDVTYGNSGSGLIHENTIIGIVTHCSFDCENIATRADLSAFENARETLCGAVYCGAGASSTAYEHISHLQVGSINNASGSDGYADYTFLSTDMFVGGTFELTLTISEPYSSDVGGCWIDWNRDGDFADSNETITTAWAGSGPYAITIAPPAGAALGATRLRVRIQDEDYDPDITPCGQTSYGEVEDYTINVIPVPDTTPPTPNPMYFTTPPEPVSTSAITMSCAPATDSESPPVTYLFDFVSGGDGGSDSPWMSQPNYTDFSLVPNTAYTYRVQARDSANPPNPTGWSAPGTTATLIENPETIAFGSVSTSTLELFAVGELTNLGVGQSAVYFDSSTAGGDGGINEWVPVPTDVATGLTPNKRYTFQAKARNQFGIETPLCFPGSRFTLAATPGAPLLANPTASTLELTVDPNGNPVTTSYTVRCVDTNPYDPTWENKYVDQFGQPVGDFYWLVESDWDPMTVTGLQPETAYTFAARAINGEDIVTPLGPSATLATVSVGDDIGDMNCDGAIDFNDINPFVLALSAPSSYLQVYPDCELLNGDVNQDGVLDFADINPFVLLLSGP